MKNLNRYSLINGKFPREFLLLQGLGCQWKRCAFCDYHTDTSGDPFSINMAVLSRVTGRYGTLDIINSGSCTELDQDTVEAIAKKAKEKKIHTIWFEAHWMYRYKLADFAKNFAGSEVKFRTGIETFDEDMRKNWSKGIPGWVTPEDIKEFFKGVCLLIGVKGQSRETVSQDIELSLANFEYFSINAFVENSTVIKRDNSLVDWFLNEWDKKLKDDPKVEILIQNTDLGAG